MLSVPCSILKKKNIAVPEQVFVAGQGDSMLAKVAGHSMATVHYSYEKSGEVAVEMLLEVISTKNVAMREIKLGYYIVEN